MPRTKFSSAPSRSPSPASPLPRPRISVASSCSATACPTPATSPRWMATGHCRSATASPPIPIRCTPRSSRQAFGFIGANSLRPGGTNYAFGGACARANGATFTCVNSPGSFSHDQRSSPPTCAAHGGQADPNALYMIWAGANDIFTAAATSGHRAAEHRHRRGHRRRPDRHSCRTPAPNTIVVFNLPDLGLTPRIRRHRRPGQRQRPRPSPTTAPSTPAWPISATASCRSTSFAPDQRDHRQSEPVRLHQRHRHAPAAALQLAGLRPGRRRPCRSYAAGANAASCSPTACIRPAPRTRCWPMSCCRRCRRPARCRWPANAAAGVSTTTATRSTSQIFAMSREPRRTVKARSTAACSSASSDFEATDNTNAFDNDLFTAHLRRRRALQRDVSASAPRSASAAPTATASAPSSRARKCCCRATASRTSARVTSTRSSPAAAPTSTSSAASSSARPPASKWATPAPATRRRTRRRLRRSATTSLRHGPFAELTWQQVDVDGYAEDGLDSTADVLQRLHPQVHGRPRRLPGRGPRRQAAAVSAGSRGRSDSQERQIAAVQAGSNTMNGTLHPGRLPGRPRLDRSRRRRGLRDQRRDRDLRQLPRSPERRQPGPELVQPRLPDELLIARRLGGRHHDDAAFGRRFHFSLRQLIDAAVSTLPDSTATSRPRRSRYLSITSWPVPTSDTP